MCGCCIWVIVASFQQRAFVWSVQNRPDSIVFDWIHFYNINSIRKCTSLRWKPLQIWLVINHCHHHVHIFMHQSSPPNINIDRLHAQFECGFFVAKRRIMGEHVFLFRSCQSNEIDTENRTFTNIEHISQFEMKKTHMFYLLENAHCTLHMINDRKIKWICNCNLSHSNGLFVILIIINRLFVNCVAASN